MQLNNQEEQHFFPDTPKMIQWIIKYSGGLIKNEKQANFVLLGVVVLSVVISLVLIFQSGDQDQQLMYGEELPENLK